MNTLRKRLLREADKKLSVLAKYFQLTDIESAVQKTKPLGFEAVCRLLNENSRRRGHLLGIKDRLCNEMARLQSTAEQTNIPPAEAEENSCLADQLRTRYDESSRLLLKCEEFLQYIKSEAYYETLVAESCTRSEIEERIATYQRILDQEKSPGQGMADEAAILVSLYKEALSSLDNDPGMHCKQLIRNLDAKLDELDKELQNDDSDSDYAQLIFQNSVGAHQLVECQEQCETEIKWWQGIGALGTHGTDVEHFTLQLTERHEKASLLLLKYREILQFYLIKYGKSAKARSELKGELDKCCRELQRLNETANASQSSKDEMLMRVELLKDAISKS